MIDFNLQWLFYFEYNNKLHDAYVSFSPLYIEKKKLKVKEAKMDDQALREFIHKYDYRKLEYFSEKKDPKYFDTLLRFKLENEKKYIRTLAACKITNTGFACIHFDEFDVFKLQIQVDKSGIYPTSSTMNVNLEGFKEAFNKVQMNNLTEQIVQMMDRDLKI